MASVTQRPLSLISVLVFAGLVVGHAPSARAATITAAYQFGHRNVLINDYGTQALGTFVLRTDPGDPDPGRERLALCIEAATSHSTATGAYRLVDNRVASPQLDYLLWKFGLPGHPEYVALAGDHDTATALAALAWFYADATRRGGGLVWADWARGFAAITPVSPTPWNALPRFSPAIPVGLRANGVELDAAERRVHDLFQEAESRRGPWTMSPVRLTGSTASVTITGPGGAIANLGGVQVVTRDRSGRIVASRTVATDRHGVAQAPVPAVPDGGSVEVTASSPGVHQEWDGHGSIQRMSTATERRLERTGTVAPTPIHLQIVKQSSDPAFTVEGGRFAVIDADGEVASTAVTGASGVATFEAIDPVAHRGPYRIRELAAPPGLTRRTTDLHVEPPYSRDASEPTTVEMVNHPTTRPLRVRKVLSDPTVGPGDLSGFGFSVTRTTDDRDVGPVVSLGDGWTPPLSVVSGDYRICETARPAWAAVLIDPGCHTVTVVADHPEPVDVVYTNVVPVPIISTRARDAADGDQMLARHGGRIVDSVALGDLVPDTAYRLEGELVALDDDGTATPTGIIASTDFTATSATAEIETVFDVPADPGFSVGVIVQRLIVDDVVVSSHEHLDDGEQTIWVPSASTRAGVIGSEIASLGRVGDEMVDRLTFRGLTPGVYEAQLVWHRRGADGTCSPTSMTATTVFETEHHAGEVLVGPVEITGDGSGATLVAVQQIVRIDEGDGRRTVAIDHADCDDAAQTVWVPALTTRVGRPATGAPALVTDTITVTGLPDPLPAGWTARIAGGVYRHDPSSAVGQQVCSHRNRTAEISIDIDGPGTFTSPGEMHGAGRFSYEERIEISADGSTWHSSWHGCAEADQTFTVAPRETTRPVHAPALPRTGGAMAAVATSLGLITSGAGGLALVGSARRRRRH
jgi:hypothetical protein